MLRKLKDVSITGTFLYSLQLTEFFDMYSCLHKWKQTFLHQNVPSTTYTYEFNSGTKTLCPDPQNLSLEEEKNLKIDTPITTFSQINCIPEKSVFLISERTKNTKCLCLVWKYTHQVCAHSRWCLDMWTRSFSVICIITVMHIQGSDILSLWDIWYLIHKPFYSIPLPCAECDNSLPFSGASSIPPSYTFSCHSSPPTILPLLPHFNLPPISWSTSWSCFQIHIQYSFGNSIFFHSLHMDKPM
jgi:hypothetical protein